MKPLAIDLFAGLGGWTEGLLAAGWDVVGFDIERHRYPIPPAPGSTLQEWHEYPAQLVLQDILTIHGSQFKDASLIVASPPCQEFSYMAMPWKRGKEISNALRHGGVFPAGYTGSVTIKELTDLFNACFRIQREACAAAGRHIPMVIENVKGAQPWVGSAKWHYGSYYLWGDVPALMPPVHRCAAQKANPDGTNHGQGSWFAIADSKNRGAGVKTSGQNWSRFNQTGEVSPDWKFQGVMVPGGDALANLERLKTAAVKNNGNGSWFNIAHGKVIHGNQAGAPQRGDGLKTIGHVNKRDGHGHTRHLTNQRESDAVKQPGLSGDAWFDKGAAARGGNARNARKAASAAIAKIPFDLAHWIGSVYHPGDQC